jgi:predicted acylesterase/phospholipase RssA
MVEMVRMVTYGSGSLIDTTFPAIALGRGRRLTDGIKRGTGDIQVEDLWLEFFAVSTDLTSGDVRVHADGPVWAAIRASVSIPGIFPPVRAPDGNVLVDGGVLNNLPVDVMRTMYAPSRLMAVDLRAPTALRSDDLSSDGEMSGWTLVRRRLAPWMDQMEVPRLVDLLLASSMLTSKSAAEDADVVIRPPVAEFGILDFTRSDELIEVGYRTTSEMIDAGALEAVID